jgi:hypothetical protein
MDVEHIIKLYTEDGLGTHVIAKMFKVGHKKISNILKENNVQIKKKGNQKKNIIDVSNIKTLTYSSNEFDLIARCKKTNVEFSDINNKSGVLTRHILENYGDINIPSNNYQRKKYEYENNKKWFEEFFDIVKIEKKNKRKCKMCDWETIDIENKTGSFENHLKKNHGINLHEYINNFPDEIKYHPNYEKIVSKNREFLSSDNFIICELCNKKMKMLNNIHLIYKHGITMEQYKLKFPYSKTVSNNTSKKLSTLAKVTNMNQTPTWTSKGEQEVKDFIESLGFIVVKGKNRKLLEGKEIDLLIPEINFGIEYNGLYYHTEKMGKSSSYHLNKTIECSLNGYKLLHIFEDEWVTKKDLVKSKLKHIFKKSDGVKIGARKVKICEITSEQKKIFLNTNHIQGNDKSNIYIGGYYNNVLVGVMTFNTKRNMTKNINGEFELSRFSTKDGYVISGLASKMIKYFQHNYNPKTIISFADRRWTTDSNNNLYTQLGFELVAIVKPTYYYYNSKVNRYKRYHKFTFGKNNIKKKYKEIDITKSEKEIMTELGYDRIWDCGLLKYRLTLK